MTGTAPGIIIKEYPSRGPIKQYRFDKVIAFSCFRCGKEKKSKLITVHNSNWNKRLCNGCYGRLLSIYEIKSNTKTEDEKVRDLSELLIKLVSKNELKLASKKLKLKENRVETLNDKSLIFLASSEHISNKLEDDYSLDWSIVIMGLCKTFENELVCKLIRPFKQFCIDLELENDLKDNDIGRIAKYIKSKSAKDPEIGTFGHFLQTSIHSTERKETSNLIKAFYDFLSNYSHSNWILDKNGLLKSLRIIATEYRNKAAHIEELTNDDFEKCKALLIGEDGVLWKMNLAIK